MMIYQMGQQAVQTTLQVATASVAPLVAVVFGIDAIDNLTGSKMGETVYANLPPEERLNLTRIFHESANKVLNENSSSLDDISASLITYSAVSVGLFFSAYLGLVTVRNMRKIRNALDQLPGMPIMTAILALSVAMLLGIDAIDNLTGSKMGETVYANSPPEKIFNLTRIFHKVAPTNLNENLSSLDDISASLITHSAIPVGLFLSAYFSLVALRNLATMSTIIDDFARRLVEYFYPAPLNPVIQQVGAGINAIQINPRVRRRG